MYGAGRCILILHFGTTLGHWTDQTARTVMCSLPAGLAYGTSSGTLLYMLYHRWRIIYWISFVILEGNERRTWKYLEVNYMVSRKNRLDVNRCEVLTYPHCWLTKRN